MYVGAFLQYKSYVCKMWNLLFFSFGATQKFTATARKLPLFPAPPSPALPRPHLQPTPARLHVTLAACCLRVLPHGVRSDPTYREHMQGMSSIERAVADSPLEDYQAIGQAAKKQVRRYLGCIALRWDGLGKRNGSRGAEAGFPRESRGRKKC